MVPWRFWIKEAFRDGKEPNMNPVAGVWNWRYIGVSLNISWCFAGSSQSVKEGVAIFELDRGIYMSEIMLVRRIKKRKKLYNTIWNILSALPLK